METWKDVAGTDYSVSSMGRVGSKRRGKFRVMKPPRDGAGYPFVKICTNGAQRSRKVHTLVAEAFLGPRPTPAHQVNHKNGIKDDPRTENLEWVTPSENTIHAYDVLGVKAARGEANSQARVTEADVREIRRRCAAGELQRVVAADYGVNQTNVSMIVRRKRWSWLD